MLAVRRHVRTLRDTFLELSEEVESALTTMGQRELGRRFAEAPVFEASCDRKAGYVRLNGDARGGGRTLHLQKTKSFIVLDVAHDGEPIGIEILAPDAALKRKLRRRASQ
jgi:hypothetical protein